ncbi:MAG: bifunctional phosphopantothenoylcysteine decarboxylase/phosphopantothenate--cysteine ligase CoaBC [Nitrospirae bacterium]|nr:bifunctional phosphopantothenoylcysteine decarboxylase/phosphopantothenate--cysteine ligase CoaBC [Nitrospirota bacterium]
MGYLSGRTVVLGVSGGIAAYKSCELARLLIEAGADVHVVMTHGGQKFVTPLTFETLTGHPVMTEVFALSESKIWHVDLPGRADAAVIAPATANIVGKIAHGIADDPVTTFLMATRARVVVAPAMNTAMYEHPAYRENEARIRSFGHVMVEPGEGFLACGVVGKGRMAEPETIREHVERVLAPQSLAGKHVLVTAGPTREYWDDARFISNPSTGKMGFALAREAWRRGADVTLVTGPVGLPDPVGVRTERVETADQMWERTMTAYARAEVVFMAAAVGDFVPEARRPGKVRKRDAAEGEISIPLRLNRDILRALGERKNGKLLVGFAAEPAGAFESAGAKLREKNVDFLVANPIDGPDRAFAADENRVSLFRRDGRREDWPKLTKDDVARRLIEVVCGTKADTTEGGGSHG